MGRCGWNRSVLQHKQVLHQLGYSLSTRMSNCQQLYWGETSTCGRTRPLRLYTFHIYIGNQYTTSFQIQSPKINRSSPASTDLILLDVSQVNTVDGLSCDMMLLRATHAALCVVLISFVWLNCLCVGCTLFMHSPDHARLGCFPLWAPFLSEKSAFECVFIWTCLFGSLLYLIPMSGVARRHSQSSLFLTFVGLLHYFTTQFMMDTISQPPC